GVRVPSTRTHVLREVDHPAAALLLEYKELARLYAAHGWSWLEEWVTGGRFHPEYVVGGGVSGRWATRGGGARQSPRGVGRAGAAARCRSRGCCAGRWWPTRAGSWWWRTPRNWSRGCWRRWPGTRRWPWRPAPAISTRRWPTRSAGSGPTPRSRCCPPCTAGR